MRVRTIRGPVAAIIAVAGLIGIGGAGPPVARMLAAGIAPVAMAQDQGGSHTGAGGSGGSGSHIEGGGSGGSGSHTEGGGSHSSGGGHSGGGQGSGGSGAGGGGGGAGCGGGGAGCAGGSGGRGAQRGWGGGQQGPVAECPYGDRSGRGGYGPGGGQHPGTDSGTTGHTVTTDIPAEAAVVGTVTGGGAAGEGFVCDGPGGWNLYNKVLTR